MRIPGLTVVKIANSRPAKYLRPKRGTGLALLTIGHLEQ
jgi:hypothetical protein